MALNLAVMLAERPLALDQVDQAIDTLAAPATSRRAGKKGQGVKHLAVTRVATLERA